MSSIVGTIPKPVRLNSAGVLRVGDSRVSLDSVVYAFNRGETAAEIQYAFDSLSLAQVHAAIAYYLHNKEKVDAYLAEQEIMKAKIRKEITSKYSKPGMWDLLLSRKGKDPKDW